MFVTMEQTIRKNELVDLLMEQEDYTKASAQRAVNAIFDKIKEEINNGNSVQIYGFGRFEKRHRKARKGRNPATGEELQIEARNGVGFKPSTQWRNEINK